MPDAIYVSPNAARLGALPNAGISTSGAASSFTPASVAAMVAWYDFSLASTLYTDTGRTAAVVADGDAIAGVADLSGNGNHLSQGTAANKPTYKASGGAGSSGVYVRHDNSVSSRYLDAAPGSKSQPNTVFAVVRLSATTSFPAFISSNAGATRNQIYISTAHWAFYAGTVQESVTTPTINTWYVVEAIFNGASSNLLVNGTSVKAADIGAQANSTLRVGADSSGISSNINDHEEVIFYNAAVSAGERSSIRAYLGTKYGITVV